MTPVDPTVFLRLGTHAEKEYFEKTLKRFNGLIIGANLVEATPGATASLIVKLCGKPKPVPYLIDPMTYAFGSYVDPASGATRDDLDWIKSDKKVKGGKGKTTREFKSSYAKLAEEFGIIFSQSLKRGSAIGPDDLESARVRSQVCEVVLKYQLDRVRREFEGGDYAELADGIPPPTHVIAPYFYLEPSRQKEWMRASWSLLKAASSRGGNIPVFAILCAPKESLGDDGFLNEVAQQIPQSGAAGVWLWFSKLDEHLASQKELSNLKKLTRSLASRIKVLNLHGSFFSMGLSLHGMQAIAHGVGYGEQKDVVPVVGQSTPTVRYYLPSLHARFGVPQIERGFSTVGVRTPADFFEKVCGCVICRGVIGPSLSNFREFGEMHYSTSSSRRAAQTPAAAKRCRFHFLLCRLQERDSLKGKSMEAVAQNIRAGADRWKGTTVASEADHAEIWAKVLATD